MTDVELRRAIDFARVTFTDQRGRRRSARVQLSWWSSEVKPGDAERIDYDPTRPSRARRRGAHDPLALAPAAVAVAVALVAARAGDRRRRRSTRPR